MINQNQKQNKKHLSFGIGYLSLTFCAIFVMFFLCVQNVDAGTFAKPSNFLTLNADLVGYWTFDGKDTIWTSATAATTFDKSSSYATGTLTNMNQETSIADGRIGQALNFDGVSDRVTTGYGATLSTSFTMAMWVYPIPSSDNYGMLIGQNSTLGIFYRGISKKITYYYSAADHLSSSSLTENKWNHIAVVNNGGDLTFYLNGVADGTAITAPGFTIAIMGDDASNETYKGRMDDIRAYNRAFSAGEITQLYNLGGTKLNTTLKTPQSPLESGLVGHWTFDGKDTIWTSATAATTLDKSGNYATGTLTNMNQATAPADGKMGQGLKFDGSNDAVTTGKIYLSSSFTISAWFRIVGAGTHSYQGIVARSTGDGATDNYKIVSLNSSSLFFSVNGCTGTCDPVLGANVTLSAPNNRDGNWHHVVGVHDGSSVKLYYDVSYSDTASRSGVINNNNATTYIGAYLNSFGYLNGNIDDVRIYNRALSAAEIRQLYNIGATKFNTSPTNSLTNGLVGHWTFDGKDTIWTSATAATTLDKSGNGNTGTLTNMNQATSPADGKIGQGLKLDGINDFITVGNSSSINFERTDPFSVFLWINEVKASISSSGYYGLVKDGANETYPGWGFGVRDSGQYDVGFLNTAQTGGMVTRFPRASVNSWHLVGFTYDGSSNATGIKTYVDGVRQSETITQNDLSSGTIQTVGDVRIGVGYGADYVFNGLLDDVRIYNRALSATEIKQLYNMGR